MNLLMWKPTLWAIDLEAIAHGVRSYKSPPSAFERAMRLTHALKHSYASDEGEDVYLASSALPEGVATVKPGTKLEFSVIDSRKGPQAMSVHIVDAPVSLAENSRVNNDDLAAMIEDTIKILDRVGNGLRQGRHPSGAEAERLGRVLRGIASQLEA